MLTILDSDRGPPRESEDRKKLNYDSLFLKKKGVWKIIRGRLFEVTPDAKTVWEYVIPDFAEYPAPLNEFIVGSHNSCFRVHPYKPEGVSWLR